MVLKQTKVHKTKPRQMIAWLEIIELQRSGKPTKELESVLFQLCDEIRKDPLQPTIRCFSRLTIESDFSIHLYHKDMPDHQGSNAGLQIAEILRNHGLVYHALWQEKTFN